MWNIKKGLAVIGAFFLALQGVNFGCLSNSQAKAANYPSAVQEIMSRPRPIVIGNQWHVSSTGKFAAGNDAVKIDFIGKYLDYITVNRDTGSPNDLFLDFYDSTHNPNTGLLLLKKQIDASAAAYGRKVYFMPYHNMTDVFPFQSVNTQPNQNFWMKPDGENIGTWDYMDKHNYWLTKSDGTITSYPGYTSSQRRFWDSRKVAVQDYWANHAKGVVDQGFDGIFADNWLRSQIDHPDSDNVKVGYNTMGGKFKQIAPNKILIGNSPPDATYTTRDVSMLEDRIAPAFSGDKSVPSYLKYSDQAAESGQACQDTYRDVSSGDFASFRLPMNLLTDNIFGVSTVTTDGTAIESNVMPYLLKLGKVGFPKAARYRADGILQRDYTEGKVLFNDTSSEVTITLPSGTYTDVNGNSVTKVTLGSLKGIVLKSKSTPAATVPTAPSSLTVASVTKGATSGNYYVNLTWVDNSDNETGFELYQSYNNEAYQVIKTPAANATGYGINIGSTPNYGNYTYKIAAVNAAGNSADSNIASTEAGTVPAPSAPTNLAVANLAKGATSGNYFVNLTWVDNSNNETGFEIYQSIDAGAFQVINTPSANISSYSVDLGASPVYATYNYKVLALNSGGKSADSNIASTKAGTPPVPAAPANLLIKSVSKDSTGSYVVNLEWADNSNNESGFEVYQSFDSGTYTLVKSLASNTTALGVNLGATPTYGTYNYKVVAVGEGGKSAESNIAGSKAGVPAAPTAPALLTITNITKGATSGNYFVNITWKDNSDNETGFELYQSFNNGAYQLIKSPAANLTGYGVNVGSAPEYGTYKYKILAVGSGGKSSDSNIVTTTLGTAPPKTPIAPSNLTLANVYKGATTGSYFVNLIWKDNSDNETGFEVYQSYNNGSYQLVKTPVANQTSYGINIGASPAKGTYKFKILATGSTGKSTDSNIVSTSI